MSLFHFKHFSIRQDRSALKVGTDAMILGAHIISEHKTNGLDIGAGTGVLSLMVVQNNPNCYIDSIEIDQGSYEDCFDNFKNSTWCDQLTAINADFLSVDLKDKYDVIFSNPPFYKNSLFSQDERVARSKHSDHLPFDQLFQKVADLLTDDGDFWMIFPFEFSDEIEQIGKKHHLFVQNQILIEGKSLKPTRMIFSFAKQQHEKVPKVLVIRKYDGTYTDEYIRLTNMFHCKKIV